MFVSDDLVFIELHKTGGSHIGRCLKSILTGSQQGKHNLIPTNLHDRYVIGSIRNPWDWYVSLWAFGCGKEGGLYQRSTGKPDWAYYWYQINKPKYSKWLTLGRLHSQIVADFKRNSDEWAESYRSSEDPTCFRLWLKLMTSTANKFDLAEGYAFSPISQQYGFLTYRFFRLFTSLHDSIYKDSTLESMNGLEIAWEKHSIVDHFVRNENLENDLILALTDAGIELQLEDIDLIESGSKNKTNTSKRNSMEFYYDEKSIERVRRREAFIINKFEYEAPCLNPVSTK